MPQPISVKTFREILEHRYTTVKAVAVPFYYGSGVPASREALAEELEERGESAENVNARVNLIRKEIKKYAGAMMTVRGWLGKVAETFETIDRDIHWTTPLGFTAVLDNRVMSDPNDCLYRTYIEGQPKKVLKNGKWRVIRKPIEISSVLQEPTEKLKHWKQRLSLAANVVHSLDANVLIATVNEGSRASSVTKPIRNWGVVHD